MARRMPRARLPPYLSCRRSNSYPAWRHRRLARLSALAPGGLLRRWLWPRIRDRTAYLQSASGPSFHPQRQGCDGQIVIYSSPTPPGPGMSIVQFTPSTRYSRFTVPSNSCGKPRSITREPKPLWVGGVTGGPPFSCQCRIRRLPSVVGLVIHSIRIDPPSFENAPYLTAFVASS